jgi:hypothetical protein
MKRAFYSKFLLIAVSALAACIAFVPCKPAAGFGGASAALSGTSTGVQPPPTQTVKAEEPIPAGQRVFYAAHSLMWDVPAPFGEAVNAFGIKDHVLAGLQSIGFSRTQQHWDQGTQAKQALKTGTVDDFIMSPMDMPDTGVDNFLALGLENNPKMRFFLQNNWAGFNNDGQKARQMRMGPPWDSTTEEQLKTLNTECEKAFDAQAKQINEKYGRPVIFIIPTSQANQTLRA